VPARKHPLNVTSGWGEKIIILQSIQAIVIVTFDRKQNGKKYYLFDLLSILVGLDKLSYGNYGINFLRGIDFTISIGICLTIKGRSIWV
jgi:hypothetical protein